MMSPIDDFINNTIRPIWCDFIDDISALTGLHYSIVILGLSIFFAVIVRDIVFLSYFYLKDKYLSRKKKTASPKA